MDRAIQLKSASEQFERFNLTEATFQMKISLVQHLQFRTKFASRMFPMRKHFVWADVRRMDINLRIIIEKITSRNYNSVEMSSLVIQKKKKEIKNKLEPLRNTLCCAKLQKLKEKEETNCFFIQKLVD